MARPEFTCSVTVRHLPEQSDPKEQQYAFAYTVTIRNTGDITAQLIARHWIITDGSGKVEEVRGPGVVGKQPRRQAKLVYQLAPTWSLGDLEIGMSVIGSGKSYGDDQNTITMPAYRVVNAFASYQLNARTQLSISANNLFNALAYTEIEGDRADTNLTGVRRLALPAGQERPASGEWGTIAADA